MSTDSLTAADSKPQRRRNAIIWFLFQRPLRPAEIALPGLVVLLPTCLLYAIEWRTHNRHLATLLVGLGATAMVVASMLILSWQRHWRAASFCIALTLPTAVVTGVLQTRTCPHATWLQLFGETIAHVGPACHNEQDPSPWWMRK